MSKKITRFDKVKSIEKIDKIQYDTGDIIIDTTTNEVYVKVKNTFAKVSDTQGLKEQVIECPDNTIDIVYGDNGTNETTKVKVDTTIIATKEYVDAEIAKLKQE